MTIDYNIINGKIFTTKGFLEGGLSIEGDKIVKIGKEPSLLKASTQINVNGALIIPGLIDIHVHLRDFDEKYKETIESGSRSAIAGGITTIIDMPNNKPPINSIERIRKKIKLIEEKSYANVGLYSLIPDNEDNLFGVTKEGIFGFKIYPNSLIYPPKDNKKLIKVLQKLAELGIPLLIHPDSGYAEDNEKNYLEKNLSPIDAFLKAHNQLEEAKALSDFIELNKEHESKIHCVHVTAKETVNVLRKHFASNFLTSEICCHHLFLTTEDLKKLKSEVKCLPPLRTKEDQIALWNSLNDNIIKLIASDHAPHSYNEKHTDFESASSGIPGLETILPLMFTAAKKGKISFEKLIPLMTSNPANHLNLERRGELIEGNFADIVVIAKVKTKINAENFESLAKWSPFNNWEVSFLPTYVFINGNLIKEKGNMNSKIRKGKLIRREFSVPLKD